MPIPVSRQNIRDNRTDLSPFMFHLTRDDRGEPQGTTARENFESILSSGRIVALNPHCLHRKKLPPYAIEKFRLTCFSETPFAQLHKLTRKIEGRQTKLEAYGFAFKREFLIDLGARQVTYINSYDGDTTMREVYDDMLAEAIRTKNWRKAKAVLPFLSAMHEKYDFGWEREWRILGDVEFTTDDVEFVILPESTAVDLRFRLKKQGIMVMSPTWGYEMALARLADQQRRLRKRLEAMAEA